MHLRVARHTTNIEKIKKFYVEFLGLEILGEFQGHDRYDGIFIGLPQKNWHLEFTMSDHTPEHKPDEDDLLVFYSQDQTEFDTIIFRAAEMGYTDLVARNPYWNSKGKTYQDPDGFRVVIARPS